MYTEGTGPTWPIIEGRTLEQAICLSRCGNYRRFYGMMQHFEACTCPFDPGNGFDANLNSVIHRNSVFQVWVVGGQFNRKSDELDLYALIVPLAHTETIAGHEPRFWTELGEAVDWVCQEFSVPGGMFGARFGNVQYTAATEQHLHFFVKVPNLLKEVREPIAKSLDDVLKNTQRGERFAALYALGVTPDQFDQLVATNCYNKEGLEILPTDQ